MRSIAMLAAATLAAGCATPPDRAWQIANNTPDWELCYVAISGRGDPNIRDAVARVMNNRRTDCNQHMAMVQAKMQQDANQAAMGLQLMKAARPQPSTFSQPTNCRSTVNGQVVNTVCN